ncbi:hypothetical protein FSP39_024187 [Pinctada imbricata]|uniref:KCTD1_15 n=1 Tax=Pinctada imbricata TaxID=66713 RepID=A0AA88XE33_PINIB|nr:hypothetical protein FSP39_024187 [Pinctada imbricata]
MASSSARFAHISPEEFKDKNLCSKKTKNATTFSMNILVEFLKDRGYNEDVTTYSKVELSQALEDFYCNVRTKNGELYKKNSLLNIRQGISRFLKSNESTIDIINDSEFTKAKSCFSSLLRKTRAEGKGSVDHHPAISVEDLQKLYNHELVFNMATPEGLLNKVMFEVMLYFCRRGQENLHNLKITDFAIEHVNGQQCVKKITTELSQNHQGTTNENEGTGALMFSTGTIRCPVILFEKYLSKRNKTSPRLFLHPKQSFTDEDEVWYRNEPIDVNAVKKFMKKLLKICRFVQGIHKSLHSIHYYHGSEPYYANYIHTIGRISSQDFTLHTTEKKVRYF